LTLTMRQGAGPQGPAKNGGNSPAGSQPGDAECRTCTGLSILTHEMRERGEKPLCYGLSSVLKQRIPVEQLEALNKENAPPTDLGVSVNIGYSRSSGMMDRTGRIPVLIRGIHLHFPRRVIPKPKGAGQESASATPLPRKYPALPPGMEDLTVQGAAASSVVALEQFQKMMRKGVKKQTEGMKKTWDATKSFVATTAQNFPSKMYKGANTLFASMEKTSRTINSKLWNYLRDFW